MAVPIGEGEHDDENRETSQLDPLEGLGPTPWGARGLARRENTPCSTKRRSERAVFTWTEFTQNGTTRALDVSHFLQKMTA